MKNLGKKRKREEAFKEDNITDTDLIDKRTIS